MTVYARRLSATSVELIAPETIDAVAVAFMARDAHALGWARCWLLDTTNTTHFDQSAVPAVMTGLAYAAKCGLQRFVLVVPDPVARLALRSAIAQAPVRATVVERRIEALQMM